MSWIGMLSICSLSLAVYGWSLSSQQFWGQEYHRLEELRRDERQLVAGTEMLKNNIAQQANAKPDGLVPQGSDNVVFLSPAPDRPQPTVGQSPAAPPPDAPTPLGY
jgi:hypothetical protein